MRKYCVLYIDITNPAGPSHSLSLSCVCENNPAQHIIVLAILNNTFQIKFHKNHTQKNTVYIIYSPIIYENTVIRSHF